MREIKFRAWDGKQFWYWGIGDINGDGSTCSFPSGTIAQQPQMQYTGLKDKNGVESYIYDIAKDELGNIFEITDDDMLLAHLQTIKFEIVGNIYKDSHLLLEA